MAKTVVRCLRLPLIKEGCTWHIPALRWPLQNGLRSLGHKSNASVFLAAHSWVRGGKTFFCRNPQQCRGVAFLSHSGDVFPLVLLFFLHIYPFFWLPLLPFWFPFSLLPREQQSDVEKRSHRYTKTNHSDANRAPKFEFFDLGF